MTQLAFPGDDKLFDGRCIRFKGLDGRSEVICGVTVAALKECDLNLQRHGLIPAEVFLASFEKFLIPIHDAARRKYDRREFESDGAVLIMVHRRDLSL